MKTQAAIVEEEGLYAIVPLEKITQSQDAVVLLEVEHDPKQGFNEADTEFLALNMGQFRAIFLFRFSRGCRESRLVQTSHD